jgi:hypothetical protein
LSSIKRCLSTAPSTSRSTACADRALTWRAVTDRVLTDAARALMRHNRQQHNDEAPPCMRWRGLARPHSPARRSLSCRLPGCCPLPTPATSAGHPPGIRLPGFPRVPRFSPSFPGHPPGVPGSPPALRVAPRSSEIAPGSVSALSGECFSTALPRTCTRASGQQSQDSLAIHRTPGVIPRVACLSTVYPPVYPHAGPQVSGRLRRPSCATIAGPACRRRPPP